jgi:molybdenum cofactor guanylyltransferase
MEISCTILAGGRSSRMGRDKALILFEGQTLLERTVALAARLCSRVLIVGRPEPENWPTSLRVEFVEDAEPRFAGPMHAIRHALQTLGTATLLLPIDTPLLSKELLESLHAAHASRVPTPIATLTVHNGRAEPLLAIYTPRILPVFDQWISRDQLSLQQCLALADVHSFSIPREWGDQLLNVNDPGSLAQLESVAKRGK